MCSVNMCCTLLVSKWNSTTTHSQTGTVSTLIITHIWKDWWECRVHTCFLFYLKRDTPSHHIFNFSFNSLLSYHVHHWGISASHSLCGDFSLPENEFFLVTQIWFYYLYKLLSSWTWFLIFQIAPTLAAMCCSAVFSRREHLLTCRCFVLFTAFPLNSQPGIPSNPVSPGVHIPT